MSIFDLRVDTCGCCEPPAPATPEPVSNRPALDEVAYRVGRYPTFRQAMVQLVPQLGASLARREGLSAVPLADWTSRSSDDYGIALIEMWAVIGDVLTFYQERYANEAWLRTAEERQAVRRLAGLLGYRLRPGVSARTHLAVALADGVELALPVGLRAQSVPKEGERPQKYETDAALAASDALNRVPVFGRPRAVTPLAAGRREVTLGPGSAVPAPDAAVLLLTPGGGFEQRSVARVDTVDGRPVLRWSRELGGTRQRAFTRGRAFRVFGHNAPEKWLTSTPPSEGSSFLQWSEEDTDFSFSSADVYLEGTVEGIEPGSRVLVDDDGVARLRDVLEVAPATRTVGSQTGAATRLRLAGAVAHDVRTTTVYELGDELQPQDWELPEEDLGADTEVLYLPYPEVSALQRGRLLILDDALREPLLVTVEEDANPHTTGSSTEFLRVPLSAPTGRPLDAASAFAFGNVVAASHGETVAEDVLGDGDAAATLQSFAVDQHPVTHIHDPRAPGGARSTLEVVVDRVRWQQRAGLYGAGPGDRVYTTDIDDEQKTTVRFGDGRTGALPPTGRANVVATYRQGMGTDGNVDAGRISVALDRPTGLDSVTNPLPAEGGVDPETTDAARDNAPNTVRTFDRAISVRDFADLAREFTGVGKAHASWMWDGQERVVHVTVGGEQGAAFDLADLRTYLDLRRDPNRSIRIGAYRDVPFLVALQVEAQPDRFTEDVTEAVRGAVRGYFGYDRRAFGQAVHLSDVYAVVQGAEGVASALVTRLVYKDPADAAAHGAGGEAVLAHAPIHGARHTGGTIQPAELATLEDPADLELTVTGGLPS